MKIPLIKREKHDLFSKSEWCFQLEHTNTHTQALRRLEINQNIRKSNKFVFSYLKKKKCFLDFQIEIQPQILREIVCGLYAFVIAKSN